MNFTTIVLARERADLTEEKLEAGKVVKSKLQQRRYEAKMCERDGGSQDGRKMTDVGNFMQNLQ